MEVDRFAFFEHWLEKQFHQQIYQKQIPELQDLSEIPMKPSFEQKLSKKRIRLNHDDEVFWVYDYYPDVERINYLYE